MGRINPFFFLSSFFYPFAFYCLFSLLTLLASGDFCENVFLVSKLMRACKDKPPVRDHPKCEDLKVAYEIRTVGCHFPEKSDTSSL